MEISFWAQRTSRYDLNQHLDAKRNGIAVVPGLSIVFWAAFQLVARFTGPHLNLIYFTGHRWRSVSRTLHAS